MFCTQASWNPLCSCKAGKNILTEAVWCLLDLILEQTGILEVTVHVLIQQMLSPTSVVKESIDMNLDSSSLQFVKPDPTHWQVEEVN